MTTYASTLRVLAVTALLALALTACASAASTASPPPTSDVTTAGPVLGTLAVDGFELAFQPAALQVDQPGRYAVTFTNTGQTDHDWVAGGTRLLAAPGETVRGEVVVPADGLAFVCSLPGHAAAGMRGQIVVASAAQR